MSHLPPSKWELPSSATIVVKDTERIGRAVFANACLTGGQHLLSTTLELSPIAHVILRPYRREVCAWCFLYDRGREWKIRDLSAATAFCSARCQTLWIADNDEICLESQRDVESFIRSSTKSNKSATQAPPEFSDLIKSQSPENANDVTSIWAMVQDMGREIATARAQVRPSKAQRALVRAIDNLKPDPDILTYTISGILSAYKSRERGPTRDSARSEVSHARFLLPSLFELVPDEGVFVTNPMTPSPLQDYTSSYLVLLRILPNPILDLISTDFVINLASRASHNAFSIRPEGKSDGDQSGEFLGWGVWPEASFFNHSCHPNVRKERNGRVWSFYLDNEDDHSSQEGQQLCITYLGGDEKDLNTHDRRRRLRDQWGFLCLCDKCRAESGE